MSVGAWFVITFVCFLVACVILAAAERGGVR